jgi:chitodextrinase
LTWVPPTDVFDGKITGYEVAEYRHGQEINIVDTKSAKATATVTGLKPGTSYSFTVSAYGPLGATDPPSRFTALIETKT